MDKPFAAMYHPYLFQNVFLCICVSLKKTIQAQMGQKKKKRLSKKEPQKGLWR